MIKFSVSILPKTVGQFAPFNTLTNDILQNNNLFITILKSNTNNEMKERKNSTLLILKLKMRL